MWSTFGALVAAKPLQNVISLLENYPWRWDGWGLEI